VLKCFLNLQHIISYGDKRKFVILTMFEPNNVVNKVVSYRDIGLSDFVHRPEFS
jgi:hypothetical protein